jgi:hypothetical protein
MLPEIKDNFRAIIDHFEPIIGLAFPTAESPEDKFEKLMVMCRFWIDHESLEVTMEYRKKLGLPNPF